MDRRNFFRILSTTSAGALAGGCGRKTEELIPLLVPEHEIVSGEEQWHPGVCTECAAGCGTLVRVMEAVRTVERDGEPARERLAAIKKIEGNPLDPVSGGRLCARGQAVVQALYHPDRLRGPMKRTGTRGKTEFTSISWDDALALASDKLAAAHAANPDSIAVLTGPMAGGRAAALEAFAKALGVHPPVVCSVAGLPVERTAAKAVFDWDGPPLYDLANAHFALGVGADFLGGWASPVYYSRQFGNFRQGRREVRGYLAHAESRLSITAAAADRWLPLMPGSETQFLGAIGRLLLDLGLARNRQQLPPAVLEVFQSVDPGRLLATCGLAENRVRELARQLGESEAPLVLAGASSLHSNSMQAISASHYVNLMLGNIGKRGGALPPPQPAMCAPRDYRAATALAQARFVLLDDVNPVYTLPPSSGVLAALRSADFVISFTGVLDDSAAWADLVLPVHHALESESVLAPAVSPRSGLAIGMPFVQPLYQTRSVEQILSELSLRLKLTFQAEAARDVVQPLLDGERRFSDVVRQGGIWRDAESEASIRVGSHAPEFSPARFDGDPSQYPLYFQPYLSLQFHEGRGSNLPWMQELPDPASSSIWGLPVEIDPKTARDLRIGNGDRVRVESSHGAIEAPAFVHPGAIPGVVSMAIGDGHTHYGRYASGRGANPLSILAPVFDQATGALVIGGTRVRLARAGGSQGWIQFAAPTREEKGFGTR